MAALTHIEVWMHGRQVGRLGLTPNKPQTCAFEYSAEWLQNGFSISPFELPLTPGLKIAPYHPFEGSFGVFADSLPDGWGLLVLHRYLMQKGINSNNLNILERLCLVGQNGRGALEFRPDRSLHNTSEYLDFERLAAESESILADDAYMGEHLEELVQRGGSPGGARPKIFIQQDGTEWLVKFRARGDKKNIGKEEYRYSLLAKQCGIEMPETRLLENQWFATQRFDRKPDGSKIHVVTASGLLQADYTIPCMDYEHIFALANRLTHSLEEAKKIYSLMCFNVMIGNRDDHARNFAFIYDKGWRFSPAYDLLPCGTEGDYHTTSVNNNPNPQREDCIHLAEKVGLDTKQATQIYDKMKKIILSFLLAVLCILPSYAAKRRVHTIGDSTMSEYKPAATPKRGWGMYLQAFFNPDSVEVNNRGKSGASTRTFYETDNLWPSVKTQMHAGDYLIIQFAHNDEKCKGEDVYEENARLRAEGKDTLTDMRGTEPNTTYKEYLRTYIREAREMGVTPVLMSPICRAYFKDGKISHEGRHDLTTISSQQSAISKDYVRCMREVAEETGAPFLDMTARSEELYEQQGKEYCMAHYFNCGDKTHTSAEGGMAIASLAYELISQAPELGELQAWTIFPSKDQYDAYARNIEEKGKKAAFAAKGEAFALEIGDWKLVNLKSEIKNHKSQILPLEGSWPAGEIDEVANRYIEYTIAAEKKKGLVIETITLPVRAQGGEGMNIHINYGFGESFREVTTIYENTALPKNKWLTVRLDQAILVPAGETLHIRILPWYDSNGKPQAKKYLQLKELKVTGKRLQ